MTLKFRVERTGSFKQVAEEIRAPIAAAATAAVRNASETAKREGRASIASAGFSRKWQSALQDRLYPERGQSMSPAAVIFHKIPYANVFEDGAVITGKPLLWLPLDNVPVGVNASNYRTKVGEPLHTINRPGKPPLLAARLRMTDDRATKGLSLSLLRRGANISVRNGKVVRGRGTVRSVPLFFGISPVRIGKKFDIKGAIECATGRLAEFYVRNFRA